MTKCTKCKGCPDRSLDPNCHNPEICPYWAEHTDRKAKESKARTVMRTADTVRFANYMKLKTRFINRRGRNYK